MTKGLAVLALSSVRARNTLFYSGLDSLEKLRCLTEADLLAVLRAMPNCGERTQQEILTACRRAAVLRPADPSTEWTQVLPETGWWLAAIDEGAAVICRAFDAALEGAVIDFRRVAYQAILRGLRAGNQNARATPESNESLTRV